MASTGHILSRRLPVPQSVSRQLRCHGLTTVRFVTWKASNSSYEPTYQSQPRTSRLRLRVASPSRSRSPPTTTPSTPAPSQPSLYQQLFAETLAAYGVTTSPPRRSPPPEHSPTPSKSDTPPAPAKPVLPLGDELRAWLEEAVPEKQRPTKLEPGATVLVLNNASRSLVESDFYRLAPQGRHVEGWAGGITKGLCSQFSHSEFAV